MMEIYAEFNKQQAEYNARVQRLERLIAAHKKTLRKLEHEEKGWIEGVLIPLAKRISTELGGMEWDIYGPFGLGAETSVYFFPDNSRRDICKDETYGITLYPQMSEERGFYLTYDTGRRSNEYPEGSIGWLNGFHHVQAELPDNILEIVALLSHHKPKEG